MTKTATHVIVLINPQKADALLHSVREMKQSKSNVSKVRKNKVIFIQIICLIQNKAASLREIIQSLCKELSGGL